MEEQYLSYDEDGFAFYFTAEHAVPTHNKFLEIYSFKDTDGGCVMTHVVTNTFRKALFLLWPVLHATQKNMFKKTMKRLQDWVGGHLGEQKGE